MGKDRGRLRNLRKSEAPNNASKQPVDMADCCERTTEIIYVRINGTWKFIIWAATPSPLPGKSKVVTISGDAFSTLCCHTLLDDETPIAEFPWGEEEALDNAVAALLSG